MKRAGVQFDAVPLHGNQDRHQGHLHIGHQAGQALCGYLAFHIFPKPAGHVGIGGSVVHGVRYVHLIKGDLFAAGADQVGYGGHFVAQYV